MTRCQSVADLRREFPRDTIVHHLGGKMRIVGHRITRTYKQPQLLVQTSEAADARRIWIGAPCAAEVRS